MRKKSFLDVDVYTKTLQRIEYLYSCYDDLCVSFSGGKDSTAVLLSTIDVARKLGRLPVKAAFIDEEAIHPTTIEYIQRVAVMPEVELTWYCLPVQHRNACSNEQPFWHPWNPDEKDIWVRDLPEQAVTYHPHFRFGMTMQEFGDVMNAGKNVCTITGIRTEESMRRHMAVTNKYEENYITKKPNGICFAHPIYDWSSADVWKLVAIKDADYNKTYDIFNKTEFHNKLLTQRVCPPYGEEPLRGLHLYAECFPELWHKMIHRVKGAATAARYANTELYSRSIKPDNISWRQHVSNLLETYNPADRKQVVTNVNFLIERHKKYTDDPIPDLQAHPVSGISWSFIATVALRGDFKGRQIGRTLKNMVASQAKLNITETQSNLLYGKWDNYNDKSKKKK